MSKPTYAPGDVLAIFETFPDIYGYPFTVLEVRKDGQLAVTRVPPEIVSKIYSGSIEPGPVYVIAPDERVMVVARQARVAE